MSKLSFQKLYDSYMNLSFLALVKGESNIVSTLKLFIGMLIAANLGAIALYGCAVLGDVEQYVTYRLCLAFLLAYRVIAYMYPGKGGELVPEYVQILSVQRSRWNNATIAVILVSLLPIYLISGTL